MTYKLTIVRRVPNPTYDDDVKDWKQSAYRYSGSSPMMGEPPIARMVDDRVLEVELTEAEFDAVKKAALGQFA